MLAFTPIPTRPDFASVSSSTVFGPAAIFLAPPPTRAEAHKHAVAQHHHCRRSLRVWTRQQQQHQAEDGFELLGSVDDDGATSDAGSDVTLVAGQNKKYDECKGQDVEVSSRRVGRKDEAAADYSTPHHQTAAPVTTTTTTVTDDATARLLPHLNAAHLGHLQARRRDADIHASWLQHTGLDVNKTGVNGPRPRCTVEELRDGMDALFGAPRRGAGAGQDGQQQQQQRQKSKSKEEKRKAKFVKKVRGLGWMA